MKAYQMVTKIKAHFLQKKQSSGDTALQLKITRTAATKNNAGPKIFPFEHVKRKNWDVKDRKHCTPQTCLAVWTVVIRSCLWADRPERCSTTECHCSMSIAFFTDKWHCAALHSAPTIPFPPPAVFFLSRSLPLTQARTCEDTRGQSRLQIRCPYISKTT